jgi:hypothetical protein
VEHVFVLVPTQQYVGKFLGTFKEFPPSQKPGSFSIDQALGSFQKGAQGGGGWVVAPRVSEPRHAADAQERVAHASREALPYVVSQHSASLRESAEFPTRVKKALTMFVSACDWGMGQWCSGRNSSMMQTAPKFYLLQWGYR